MNSRTFSIEDALKGFNIGDIIRDFDKNYNVLPNSVVSDVEEKDDRFIIKIELPGTKKEDVKISITDSILEVKGKTGIYNNDFLFTVQVNNYKSINAQMNDGILTIEVNKVDKEVITIE
jgi:HSP20 family molecular chaperone IbpA